MSSASGSGGAGVATTSSASGSGGGAGVATTSSTPSGSGGAGGVGGAGPSEPGGAIGTVDASTVIDAGDGPDEPAVFSPRPTCGTPNDYSKRYCAGIESVALTVDGILDEGGDGQVSPGEKAVALVTMRNTGAVVQGPCIGLLADNPGVAILEDYNPLAYYYAITDTRPEVTKMHFRVEPKVAPGTRIRFVAWFDVQGASCTNGQEIRFEIRVAD